MTTPTPNDVLNALMDGRVSDEQTRVAMGRLFLETTVAVPSTGDPAVPGAFSPLLVQRDSEDFVVALTSRAALERSESVAQFALEMTGANLIASLAPHLGVVVDNGTSSFTLTAAFLSYLRDSREDS